MTDPSHYIVDIHPETCWEQVVARYRIPWGRHFDDFVPKIYGRGAAYEFHDDPAKPRNPPIDESLPVCPRCGAKVYQVVACVYDPCPRLAA